MTQIFDTRGQELDVGDRVVWCGHELVIESLALLYPQTVRVGFRDRSCQDFDGRQRLPFTRVTAVDALAEAVDEEENDQ